MAASRSTRTASGFLIQAEPDSFKNRATPTPTGIASSIAMIDVMNVPKMNGSAP